LSGRHRQSLVFGLTVVGVVIALLCVNAEAELLRRRQASCDASLALPASVTVLGVIGVIAGLAAIGLLGWWFGRDRSAIVVVLFVTAAAAVVFEAFALITVFEGPGALTC
jgi:hypothetical protein